MLGLCKHTYHVHIHMPRFPLTQVCTQLTGHEFVRINNHAHTDVQEYLGGYVSDENGRLVFAEGPLVKALRKGQWLVLDELNLAPSDVLEMLNR